MPKSQVASRAAQDAPITINQATLRQARLDQRYRQISQADNASTTGLLVNPPAAVIANPTGAGGQAGSQGQFGAGMPVAGAGIQTMTPAYGGSYNPTVPAPVEITGRGRRDQPRATAPAPSGFQQVVDVYSNMTPQNVVNAFVDPFRPTPVGTSRRDKGGNVNPTLARNVFAGVQTGAGTVDRPSVYPAYANSVQQAQQQGIYPAYANSVQAYQQAVRDNATQSYVQGEKGYIPIPAPELARMQKERDAGKPSTNSPQFPGTAGLYTYGQFSNKEEPFLMLMEKLATSGINAGLAIPATTADSLGLTQNLQDPNSGWKLVDGSWRQTGNTGNPAIPPAGTSEFTSTGFYQDYAAKNIPYEQQLRWDGTKWVTVGQWQNRRNKNFTQNREAKLAQKRRQARKMGRDEVQASYGYSGESLPEQTPSPFMGSWGVVNFNTGSG